MKFVICLLVTEALLTVNAIELPLRPKMVQFCGKKLMKALDLVCDATDLNVERDLEMLRMSTKHDENYELQTKKGPPNNFLKRSHRLKRDYDLGIVETCCQKPCSFTQLRDYC